MTSVKWLNTVAPSVFVLWLAGCQGPMSVVQSQQSVTDSLANRQIRAQSTELAENSDQAGYQTLSNDGVKEVASNDPLESSPLHLAPNASLRTLPEEMNVPTTSNGNSRSWQTELQQRPRGSRAGTLGRSFAVVGARSVRPGNPLIREAFGNSIVGVSANANMPLSESIDLRMGIGSSEADTSITNGVDTVNLEISAVVVAAGLTGHFQPGEAVDPFVFGNLQYVDVDAEASVQTGFGGQYSESGSVSAVGYNVGLGVQCELDKHIAISPWLSYADKDEYGNGGASIGAQLNIWGGESLLFYLETSQSLEDGTRILGAGAGLQF